MQNIVPHLWFNKEAKEATKLYASLFANSKINSVSTIHDTPSGDCDIVSFELAGQPFMAISAGPYFKFTPAISFLVMCSIKEEVDKLWNALSKGGSVLMELGEYPFSEKYGWLADKYGLSWQLMFADEKIKQKITPVLLFVGKQAGRAEEAMNFYVSLFENSGIGKDKIMRYGKNEKPDKDGTIKFAPFKLLDRGFIVMDSAHEHKFTFNEAISFIVKCENQKEIDYFWEKLSADPKAEQCGWLKDKFGLSWQIVPAVLGKMMQDKDAKKRARVTEAFLKMKKFDIKKLEEAYEGR